LIADPDLPPGAWVFRLDMSQRAWAADVFSSSIATDHVTATAGITTVLFGGLLHNRMELVQLLGSDTGEYDAATLIARAYERWGEGAIERVQGACAIVICDAGQPMVIAARDRLGVYPLFHAGDDSRLLLSNSIGALLGQRGISNAINLPAVADHLRHVWPFADETYFEGVHRVPPGNVLSRNGGRARLRRYWEPAPGADVDWIRPDEIEQFDSLFEQAVARCQAPGKAGIFLSGGLDSVSIAAVAASRARALGEPDPLALSLVFPHPDANEEPVQRAVATTLGLQQILLHWDEAVGPQGLFRESIDLSSRGQSPLLNLWMPAYERLAIAGREHGCVTILTGGGGDEWLMVSPYYAADLIRRLDLAGLIRLYNEHRRSHKVSPLGYLRRIVWLYGLRPLALDATVTTLQRRMPSLLTKATLRRLEQKAPPWLAPDPALRRKMADRELRRREMQWAAMRASAGSGRKYPRVYFAEIRSGLEHPLVSMELEELYTQGRRLGLRMLQPFWDAQLVEFLYRTPPPLLNEGGRSKALVRRAVARRFPGLGFEHQRKVAATGFVRALIEDEGRRAWSELHGVGSLASAGLVDGPVLRRRIEEVLGNRETRRYYFVWDLLVVESFLRIRQSDIGR
jgi:asparagine synthase (glutamine-hydrolysing)